MNQNRNTGEKEQGWSWGDREKNHERTVIWKGGLKEKQAAGKRPISKKGGTKNEGRRRETKSRSIYP